jgi:beta-galactosidase
MGFGYSKLEYYDNTKDLDVVSWDNYKRTQWDMKAALDPSVAALSADTMRGLKKQNFWVMEQQSGGGGWEIVAVTPKPGELRLWTYQSIAHGAEGILYFRWRTCRTGTEQNWQGILEHHGIQGRRYDEIAQIGHELLKVGEIIEGSQINPTVAIMQSYDSRFAFQIQPNNPRFSYEKQIHDLYHGFFTQNIPVEIVSEKDEIANFKLVIVPAMYILSKNTATILERFAASGGIVVFTPRTGVKDLDNKVVNLKLPGLVSKMAGVEIEDYVSMPINEDNKVQFGLPNLEGSFSACAWADILDPTTAKPIAWYLQDYYANKIAATINTFGDGQVIYLGTLGDASFYAGVSQWLIELTKLQPLLESPPGVEIAERWQGAQRLLFVLNHTADTQDIMLDGNYMNLLNDKILSGEIILEPFDVLILTRSK